MENLQRKHWKKIRGNDRKYKIEWSMLLVIFAVDPSLFLLQLAFSKIKSVIDNNFPPHTDHGWMPPAGIRQHAWGLLEVRDLACLRPHGAGNPLPLSIWWLLMAPGSPPGTDRHKNQLRGLLQGAVPGTSKCLGKVLPFIFQEMALAHRLHVLL